MPVRQRVIHGTVQDQPVQIVTTDTCMYQEHEKFHDLFEVLWVKFFTVAAEGCVYFYHCGCKLIHMTSVTLAAYAICL